MHGIEVKLGERGEWLLVPQSGYEKTQLEINGPVSSDSEAKRCVLVVNVSAHYPRVKGYAARTVEFLEFVYVSDKKR